MTPLPRIAAAGALLLASATIGITPAQEQPADTHLADGIDIQLRGPVHEAFAQPADVKPEPGQAVPKQPPEPIPEEPPGERPEGANVQWIPGYWAWDAERNEFMWVSGTYRNAPAGRQWVAGHWVHTAEGWRWVPGFWAPEQQRDLTHVPEPPAPLQQEPNIAAPDDEHTWIPGTWIYREPRFVWRPGYWSPYRFGRVWTAARYLWTPTGYLFCDGYWDYPLEDRGLLFAPVYFHRPFWNTAGWCWRPSYVVSFSSFYDSCFRRNGSFHYYYGNYYGARYAGLGYRPWFNGRGCYDPVFAYHRWHHHRHDGDWHGRQRQLYRDRDDGRLPGPPRNLAQQEVLTKNGGKLKQSDVRPTQVVAPLSQVKDVNKNVNLVRLSKEQAATQQALAKRSAEIARIRANQERANAGNPKEGRGRDAERPPLKLPPPVAGAETVRSAAATVAPETRRNEIRTAPSKSTAPWNPYTDAGKFGKPDSARKALSQSPVEVAAPTKATPKAPKLTEARDVPPRKSDAPSPPKIADRSITPQIAKPNVESPSRPRVIEVRPAENKLAAPRNQSPSVPKVYDAPKSSSFKNPAIRIEAPRTQSVPRNVPSVPRVSSPSIPRASAAPRSSPAPRSAPASRSAPSSRSSRGR